MRSFVAIGFEDLCRQWLAQQARQGKLPFTPDAIGSHWSRHVQVDVVAIDWENRQILLGECKWGTDRVDRQVVRELIEQKAPHVRSELPNYGEGWAVHFALFSRAGFTEAALAELKIREGLAVDLVKLDEGL